MLATMPLAACAAEGPARSAAPESAAVSGEATQPTDGPAAEEELLTAQSVSGTQPKNIQVCVTNRFDRAISINNREGTRTLAVGEEICSESGYGENIGSSVVVSPKPTSETRIDVSIRSTWPTAYLRACWGIPICLQNQPTGSTSLEQGDSRWLARGDLQLNITRTKDESPRRNENWPIAHVNIDVSAPKK
jgi:hypothetical protein